ncbi:MAG: DUF4405 domain-containing protein [Polyangiaceae bacterium]|nr:DUF4405 domain-containing protein [Polyangiaceae bacterium]
MSEFTRRFLRLSTPALATSFVVVAVTGIVMFLHDGAASRGVHELAGIAMVGATGLHVARNWKALLAYRYRALYLTVAALIAVASLAVAFLGTGRGGLDAWRMRVEHASLVELAPVLHETPARLVAHLQEAGFNGVTPEASPAQIATASHKSGRDVLEALVVTARAASQKTESESRRIP